MTFVLARGAKFHTVDVTGVGPPVVMLHGLFTGSVASWYLTAAPILARQFQIRLLDWRGHGLSERTPSGYGSADMAEDLAALTADLDPFTVVGHSFGAVVAARFALAHPDRVTKIVLVEPPLVGLGEGWWTPERSATLQREIQSADLPDRVGRATSRRSRALCALIEETSILAELEQEPSLTDEELVGLARKPILLVAGARSMYRSAIEAVAAVDSRIGCQVLDGGHELHVDARRELADLLDEFLAVRVG